MIFGRFQPVFHSRWCSFCKVFGSKILATPISRGKNFGGVFFDTFRKSEPESVKIMTVDTLFAEIPN